MTVYVSCHGGLFDTRPETFVPYYMPTVKFYAKADENLYQSNELGALARADLGIGDANDTYAAKGTIPNYVLTPDSSKEAAMATFFEPSAGSLYLIPKVTALCTWDGKQDDGVTPKRCDPEKGMHYCSGLFGTMAWADSKLQDEVVMLCCRGIIGRTNSASRPLGGDTYTTDATSAFSDRWTKADDAGKAAIWDDPELPEGTKVTMLTSRAVSNWVAVRQARGVAASYGDLAMIAYVESPENKDTKEAMEKDPEIAASLARGGKQVSDFKSMNHEARFATWPTMSDNDRNYLGARDEEIGTWVRNHGDRARLFDGQEPQPSNDQYAVTAGRVGEIWGGIATGLYGLTGTQADTSDVGDIAQAYTAFMNDVQSLTNLTGDSVDRQRAAYGLYQAGADLGSAIAVYQENQDEDNLKSLHAAGENVATWMTSIG